MQSTVRTIFAVLFVLIAALVGWAGYSWFARTSDEAPYGAPFALTDMNGQPITEAALQGHPSAVFFGFTNCPEVCPTTLFEMKGWFDKLGDEGKTIKAFFVSVDPERDTSKLLKDYISNVTDRVTGITGDPTAIAAMIKAWGVYAKKVPTSDGSYTMDHTALVFLINSKGQFHGTIAYGEDPDTAFAKMQRLAKL
ncbi:MAG: SCO family protein [Rhizobiaceae bacterium]